MQIREAQLAKAAAMRQVKELLQKLEDETGVTVTDVVIRRTGKDRVSTDRVAVKIICQI